VLIHGAPKVQVKLLEVDPALLGLDPLVGCLLGGDQDAVTASDLFIDVCRANCSCRLALCLGCQVFDKEKPLTA
jgi:hypothetical protein